MSLSESAEKLQAEGPPAIELGIPSTSDNSAFIHPPNQPNLTNFINDVPAFPAASTPVIDAGKAIEVKTVESITADVLANYGVRSHQVPRVLEVIKLCDRRHLLALKLLAILFTPEELASSNCKGNFEKEILDPSRLNVIKGTGRSIQSKISVCLFSLQSLAVINI